VSTFDCFEANIEVKVNMKLESLSEQSNNENLLLVFYHVHMMSDVQRHYIASRCLERKCSFIFIVEAFNPSYLQIQVENHSRETSFIKATIFEAGIDIPGFCASRSKRSAATFRIMRLLFGSLMKLKYIEYIEQDNPLRLHQLLQEQSQGVDVSPNVIEDVIGFVWDLVREDPQDFKRIEECATLHEFVVTCCYRFVLKTDGSSDVTFEKFVQTVPLCQFLTQQHRVEAWLRTVLLPSIGVFTDDSITGMFRKKSGWINIHSHHLLKFMRSIKDPHPPVDAPCYGYVPKDSSLNLEELLLQQSIQKNELDWNMLCTDWHTFPHSLNFLMNLLLVNPAKLKILFSMSPIALYQTLENATRERYELVLSNLEMLLIDDQLSNFVSSIIFVFF
jgi:hypothetical protein